jgi:hypothetical protein
MTAMAKSDIPASINTVEGLAIWCGMLLNHLYPNDTVRESPDRLERVSIEQNFPFSEDNGQSFKIRQIVRVSVELNKSYQMRGKRWEHAQELGTLTIPTDFKS